MTTVCGLFKRAKSSNNTKYIYNIYNNSAAHTTEAYGKVRAQSLRWADSNRVAPDSTAQVNVTWCSSPVFYVFKWLPRGKYGIIKGEDKKISPSVLSYTTLQHILWCSISHQKQPLEESCIDFRGPLPSLCPCAWCLTHLFSHLSWFPHEGFACLLLFPLQSGCPPSIPHNLPENELGDTGSVSQHHKSPDKLTYVPRERRAFKESEDHIQLKHRAIVVLDDEYWQSTEARHSLDDGIRPNFKHGVVTVMVMLQVEWILPCRSE